MNADDFDWPCQKRKPHAPHDDVDGGAISQAAYRRALARSVDEPSCPGVRAHPLTQIGIGGLPLKSTTERNTHV